MKATTQDNPLPHAALVVVAACARLHPSSHQSQHPFTSAPAEVGRVADRTGSKRIEADQGGGKTDANSAKLWASGAQGPVQKKEYACTATMASTVAARLVAAKHLDEDEALAIPMRSRQRVKLAPEALQAGTAGRAVAKRVTAKLGPVYGPTTVVKEFAALL